MTTQDNQDGHTTTHHPQEHILDNGTIQSKNRLLIPHLKGRVQDPLGEGSRTRSLPKKVRGLPPVTTFNNID